MRDAVVVATPLVGSIVEDRYRIEEELGAGAMGTVYRGRHIKVGRTVAIKVLHDHLVADEMMVERFEREAQIAARLEHPNLVGVIDVGATSDGQRCMVLEYAPGRSLADLVTRPLPRALVIELTRQLLRGLDHAHSAGLIHRDLKPENVLVEEHADGSVTPRIVDFGIAVLRDNGDDSAAGRRLTTTGFVLGTPRYMAPEQASGEEVDHRADLFALGVIVYEMLAGMPPFDGSGVEIMMANITQEPPSIATRSGVDVDPLLEAFARTLMARARTERFASAPAALEVLQLIECDRDAAACVLGLGKCAPEPNRERDEVITRKHIISVAMVPLAKPSVPMPLAEMETAPIEIAVPPRRRRWRAFVGAAMIIGLALVIVVLLANAARAHRGSPGQSPIQQTAGCTRADRIATPASTVRVANDR